MPTNTRTGATDSGVCAPTPSDFAGNLDNIFDRLEAIEAVLAQFLGSDTTANQLSDITPNGGVLTATAINAGRGWVTEGTFSGVSISSLGWKLARPNGTLVDYPIVTMDENGVLQFGLTAQGEVHGAAVTTQYLICQPSSGTLTAGLNPQIDTIISQSGTAFGTTQLADGIIDIETAGYYRIDVHIVAGVTITTGSRYMQVVFASSGSGGVTVRDMVTDNGGLDQSNRAVFSASFGFEALAGDSITIVFSGVPGISHPAESIVTIEKRG